MTRIVTTTYRHKRPPRKRKPVAIAAPAVVTAEKPPPPYLGDKGGGRSFGNRPHNGAARSGKHTVRGSASRAASGQRRPKPAIVTTTSRKRRSEDGPHLPMELPLPRKPVEHDGDNHKRLKAAMARRLRGE